ncbi:SsgA family sporulation/cell division regulator [Streptomyces sp. NPDC048002]|uniref:SsgA family sporulation/cell division regulator n=1 Tax=unclassified Streptomyces TaxID=2593676 RepID=UPI0033E2F2A8
MDVTLEQPVQARLITADERELPATATLRYGSADPLAVYVDFPAEVSLDGEGVTWTFARSLLAEGLHAAAGGGDVHIWPCGPLRTVMEFHSPFGLALMQFDSSALRGFLVRSYAVVPAGQEDVAAAVEEGLSALFGSV